MSEVPQIKNPKRIPFDMGRYSDELAGLTLNVLQNPTRGFRQSYVDAAFRASLGMEARRFMDHLAVVLGVADADAAQALVDDVPDDAFHWLFLYTLGEWNAEFKVFGTQIAPHLLTMWEEYITEQVKAAAARRNESFSRGEKNDRQASESE